MKPPLFHTSRLLILAVGAALASFGLVGWAWALPDSWNAVRYTAGGVLAIGSGLMLARLAIGAGRDPGGADWVGREQAPSLDDAQAVALQEDQTRRAVSMISGEAARDALNRSLDELQADRDRRGFRVVVLGTGSAGKTSLVNVLLGREAGAADPLLGTTRRGEVHTEIIEGVEGAVLMTDTPGLSEYGAQGEFREREARELAEAADLILFVVDHDLVRAEFDALSGLAALRKRLIVVFNKIDRFTDEDRAAVLARLRERLRGKIAPEDVVAVAAAPRPVPVRLMRSDGASELVYEPAEPDATELEARIARILESEGPSLRAANLLLRARRLERKAADELARERRARALAVVEKYQWIVAVSSFTGPVAALNLAAGGAVQARMVDELAHVFGVEAASSRNRALTAQMLASLVKLGLGEAATALIAGLFKRSFLGFAAAGAVQAVATAYLTHVAGLAFVEYFARGRTWGGGGIDEALLRQFNATSRIEFLHEFVKQAIDKLAAGAGLRPAADDPAQHQVLKSTEANIQSSR